MLIKDDEIIKMISMMFELSVSNKIDMFDQKQWSAIQMLSNYKIYITPGNNTQGEMRGKCHIGNPEKNQECCLNWYTYSDQEGSQYIHPPGPYTGKKDSYVYELNPTSDYHGYYLKYQHESVQFKSLDDSDDSDDLDDLDDSDVPS